MTTSGDVDGGRTAEVPRGGGRADGSAATGRSAATHSGAGQGGFGTGSGGTSAGTASGGGQGGTSSGSGGTSAGTASGAGPDGIGAGSGGPSAGRPSAGGTRRLPQAGTAEVVVDAAPEAVWAVLADVTRIGEWSHECRGAEWLDGATAAAPGVRFRGRNKVGALVRWARVCVIRAVDAPHELVWETVGPPLMRDASLWRVRLDPVDRGTRIRQEFRILSMAAWADRVVAAVIPAHRDRIAALEADLRRLGEVARISAGGRRTS